MEVYVLTFVYPHECGCVMAVTDNLEKAKEIAMQDFDKLKDVDEEIYKERYEEKYGPFQDIDWKQSELSEDEFVFDWQMNYYFIKRVKINEKI